MTTHTDKHYLIEMLDRVKCDYIVSDRFGNSMCIENCLMLTFDGNDMLRHVVVMVDSL